MTKDIQAAILRATGRFIEKRLTALEPRFKALEDWRVAKDLQPLVSIVDLQPSIEMLHKSWQVEFEKRQEDEAKAFSAALTKGLSELRYG